MSASKKKSQNKSPIAKKRLRVIYKGRVQGVGFRFTAENIAHATGVTGWVRNLPNGDVELMMEGSMAQLEETMDRLQSSSVGPFISKKITEWKECSNEFSDFRIEFLF